VILVTGATGFVGSHLVDSLLARGDRVRVIARGTSNLRWIEGKPVEIVRADLGDRAALADAVRDVRAILHFGGRISAFSERDFMDANAGGTENLARAFLADAPEKTGRLFLYCSSLAAGGPGRVDESIPPRPISAYGRSKLEGERRALAILDGRARVVIFRPPAVYGPRDEAILKFLRLVARGWVLRPGPPGARFSLIHVRSLVQATMRAIDSETARGVYYVSDDRPCSWEDIGALAARILGVRVKTFGPPLPFTYMVTAGCEAVARITRKPPLLSFDKVREVREPLWVCDPGKARRDFGYSPGTDLDQGIEETVRWYRDNKWLRVD
jgi:dihydroflavonol-4-reductase